MENLILLLHPNVEYNLNHVFVIVECFHASILGNISYIFVGFREVEHIDTSGLDALTQVPLTDILAVTYHLLRVFLFVSLQ